MADSSVPITSGAGTDIDTRTEATNGNHRQVVVIGDPSTNAGVAPVDATNGIAVDNKTLPPGAATAAKQPALGTAGSASIDVITVQGIASGTAQPTTITSGSNAAGVTPTGSLQATIDPAALFVDSFDGGTIDTTSRWTTSGTVVPTQSNGNLLVNPASTASATSAINSQFSFLPGINQGAGIFVTLEASTALGNHRMWGFGVPPSVPGTAAAPLQDAWCFEVDTSGVLRASVYAAGTRVYTQALTTPTDGLKHLYYISLQGGSSFFYMDSTATPVGFTQLYPAVQTLPFRIASLNSGSVTGTPTLSAAGAGVTDYAHQAQGISDGVLPYRKATVSSTGALSTSIASGTVTTVSTVTALTNITNWGNVVDNGAFVDGTTRLMPGGYIFDEVAGTALTENDAAAARVDSKRAQVLTIEDATTRGQRTTVKAASTAAVASDTALVVAVNPGTPVALAAGTNNIGDVDVLSSALPTGAATAALQTQPGVDIGDVTINNASGGSAVNIQDGGNSITVDGTVTANAGTNLNTSALALDATLTGGTQQAKITDGTNVASILKSDGTAAGQNSQMVGRTYLSVPFTTTTVQAVGTTDVGNYAQVSVQITSQGGSSTVTFQGSNDNTNWVSIRLLIVSEQGSSQVVLSTTAASSYYGPLTMRYFRLNVTGIASGTTAGTIIFSSAASTPLSNQHNINGTVSSSTAIGSAVPANAFYDGLLAQTANPTAATAGNLVGALSDKLGKQVVVGSIRDLKVQQVTTITASTSETTILTAVASTFLDLYGLIITNTSATAVNVAIKDATAGTTRLNIAVPAGDTRGFMLNESGAHNQGTVNNNWTATSSASVSSLVVTAFAVKNI